MKSPNMDEAPVEGFYNPRDGPLFQYGFRSPTAADSQRDSSQTDRSSADLGNRAIDLSARPRKSAVAGSEGGDKVFQGAVRTSSLQDGPSRGNVPAASEDGDVDSKRFSDNDVITKAVNTAFGRNPPPEPPNNARRGVSNIRPSGGLLGGYALSFPDSQPTSPQNSRRAGLDIGSGVSGIGFNHRMTSRPSFGSFPGYGPNGFFDSFRTNNGNTCTVFLLLLFGIDVH